MELKTTSTFNKKDKLVKKLKAKFGEGIGEEEDDDEEEKQEEQEQAQEPFSLTQGLEEDKDEEEVESAKEEETKEALVQAEPKWRKAKVQPMEKNKGKEDF